MLKVRGIFGPEPCDQKRVVILGRVVDWRADEFWWEADPRHVEKILEACGMTSGNSAIIPGAKLQQKDGDDQQLAGEDLAKYRSVTATANFIAQDRPDVRFAVKELCRDMAKPTRGARLTGATNRGCGQRHISPLPLIIVGRSTERLTVRQFFSIYTNDKIHCTLYKDFISAVPHDEPLTKFCTLLTCSVLISTPLDVGMCATFWLKKKGHPSSHISQHADDRDTLCILELKGTTASGITNHSSLLSSSSSSPSEEEGAVFPLIIHPSIFLFNSHFLCVRCRTLATDVNMHDKGVCSPPNGRTEASMIALLTTSWYFWIFNSYPKI